MANKGVNKVILIGYLGNNPEIKYMSNGNSVTTVSLATSESWKDKNTGELKEKTEWHKIVFFGKLSEISNEYLKKGSQIYIEGKIQTRKWKDQSNNDKYITEIIVGIGGIMQILNNTKNNNNINNNTINKSKDISFNNKKDDFNLNEDINIPEFDDDIQF